MRIYRGTYNLPADWPGCVATIGNFDGVHLGHQAVIDSLGEAKSRFGLPSLLMTFEPHPVEYFNPDKAPSRLCSFREKMLALRGHALDAVLLARFNRQLAGLQAESFIEKILVERLAVRYLVIGDDFRFGAKRQGDFNMLASAGDDYGFEVTATPTIMLHGDRVSSTRLRNLLAQGDFDTAAELLGRPFAISGRVDRGDARGRQIGFPTANLAVRHRKTPVRGVFAVRVEGLEDGHHVGVANLGTRPTVDGMKTLLEVHLFDFNRDIYNEHIEVVFLKKIRDEQRFESLQALIDRIHVDVGLAREFFQSQGYKH